MIKKEIKKLLKIRENKKTVSSKIVTKTKDVLGERKEKKLREL